MKILDRQTAISEMDRLALMDEPFLFVVDYSRRNCFVVPLSEIDPTECLYQIGHYQNIWKCVENEIDSVKWRVGELSMSTYRKGFDIVKEHLQLGDSYLVNLTCQVPVETNLSLHSIFLRTHAKYKIWIKDTFVCFSPETFIQIKDGEISSFPMKGTIDAEEENADKRLIDNEKESAEHATIVDLIRNDLSIEATNVRVEKYRYIDEITTNKGKILQTSSKIVGWLKNGWQSRLGEILFGQLPAGSITGAPKKKTVEIIAEAENYDRGFYTGVMGIYQNGMVDSAVMIRYVEEREGKKYYKAGGGITAKSRVEDEYREVKQKIYLPLTQGDRNEKMKQKFSRYIETIKVEDGVPENLKYHQARYEETMMYLGVKDKIEDLQKIIGKLLPYTGVYKLRVVYSAGGIEEISLSKYGIRPINSLKLVRDDEVTYALKEEDRSRLNELHALRGIADETLIVKNGYITETTYANVAMYDGKRWVTPSNPLLRGTKRQRLIEEGVIAEGEILAEDLNKYQKIAIFNAMIEFGEVVVESQFVQ